MQVPAGPRGLECPWSVGLPSLPGVVEGRGQGSGGYEAWQGGFKRRGLTEGRHDKVGWMVPCVPSNPAGCCDDMDFFVCFPRTSTDTWIHSQSTMTFPKSAGQSSLPTQSMGGTEGNSRPGWGYVWCLWYFLETPLYTLRLLLRQCFFKAVCPHSGT